MDPIQRASFDLPKSSSTIAGDVDWMYNFIWWWSAVFFVVIVAVTIIFVLKYRRKDHPTPKPTGHSTVIEVAWTFLPLVLLGYLFWGGWKDYMKGVVAPKDAIEIRVRGMQWNWEFEHASGIIEMNELKVPANRPVKLIMSSSDVLHSFFVPDFRVKRDVVPGMFTTLWFEATEAGDYQVYCTEYCGAPKGITNSVEMNTNHSTMLAMIHAVPEKEYQAFIKEGPPLPADCEGKPNAAACWGEKLYAKYGCRSCHNIDGLTQQPGPNWKGLFGSNRKMSDGSIVKADENYIRESILQPQAKIVAGYENIAMSVFRVPDKQIDAIIEYMKSLNE